MLSYIIYLSFSSIAAIGVSTMGYYLRLTSRNCLLHSAVNHFVVFAGYLVSAFLINDMRYIDICCLKKCSESIPVCILPFSNGFYGFIICNQNNEVTFIGELLYQVTITNNPGGKIPGQNNEFTFISESLSRMPITKKPMKKYLNQNKEFTFIGESISRMPTTIKAISFPDVVYTLVGSASLQAVHI